MKKKARSGNVTEKKAGWRERVNRALDIPPDLWPHGTLIEIRGRESMTVRGGGKILVYTPERICLALGEGVLSVCGRRLFCTSYCVGAIGIDGQIDDVRFAEDASEADV